METEVGLRKCHYTSVRLETTGVAPGASNLLSVSLAYMHGWSVLGTRTFTFYHGEHGSSNDNICCDDSDSRLEDVVEPLFGALTEYPVLVGHNIGWVLNYLMKTMIRIPKARLLTDSMCMAFLGLYCVDTMLIDREFDRYRKGSRKFEDVCAHYGVRETDGLYDFVAEDLAARTGYLLQTMVTKYELEDVSPREVHESLVEVHAEKVRYHATREDRKPDVEELSWPYSDKLAMAFHLATVGDMGIPCRHPQFFLGVKGVGSVA